MSGLLGDYCEKLGLPRSYGDPLSGRIDCTIIHEGNPYGCEVNALNRFYKGFIKIFPVSKQRLGFLVVYLFTYCSPHRSISLCIWLLLYFLEHPVCLRIP